MSLMRLCLAGALALAAFGASADSLYHPLASGGFTQNWSNTGLITVNNDWSMVPSLEGYRGDDPAVGVGVDPRTLTAFVVSPLNVTANNTDASNFVSGGIVEVESGVDVGTNPTIGFQGSGTADAPFLLLRLNTSGCSAIQLSYTLRDIDTLETVGTQQPVVVQGRVGESSALAEIPGTYVAIANNGSTTSGAVTLPVAYENQSQVQLRWLTTNANATDAMIGIDDILVSGNCGDVPPAVTSTTPANLAINQSTATNITVQFSEAVTTNPGWFTLNCTGVGTVAVTESGVGATRTLDPVPNLPANASCTANILAADVLDQDGTPNAMTANYSFSFGTDAPPTVTSTVPVNAATGVARNANIVVNFSEAVSTTAGWATLVCGGNPIASTTSGTGATRTLDPDTDLAFGTSCTVTVNAAGVTDLDGSPEPMAADFVFGFTVIVDAPPTVTSTVPANNATSVALAANLTINFSEPVTLGGSWFAIECTVSGGHPAVVSGGPMSFTLDPIANFVNSEVCAVTLIGALIVDQDGTPQPAADYSFSFTTLPSTANYYQGVDTSSAAALRTSLHNLIDDHTAYQYSISGNSCNLAAPTVALCDTWDILESAEQDPTESGKVLDVYRNRKYTKITDRSGATGPLTYNREHTWPNSLGFNDLSGLDGSNNPYSPYTDTHMLYASASDHNGDRGNKPYANCPGCAIQNPTDLNHGQGGPGFPNQGVGPDGNAGSYEVWVKRKGDVARAILYMDVRYAGGTHANGQPEPDLIATDNRSQLQITPSGTVPATGYMGLLTTLLEWHAADPPDAIELARHEVVYSFQSNRNPFIDHPEYAACLYQNQCTAGSDIFANGFE